MSSRELTAFRKSVWQYWKKDGRHDLPWRRTRDPYRIMVSEVMLQQTQVARVIEKYRSFLRKFPTIRALAKAPLREVLKEWSGLGYNRRGKYLHDAAKVIVEKHGGRVPKDAAALRALPGMGPYTASAIRVFAWDLPDILIETNIRTAYFNEASLLRKLNLHKQDMKIGDPQIMALAHEAATGQDPRMWHWALMDYGAYLKKTGVRNNSRSKHYTKQSKFDGSLRQVRGAILRELHAGRQPFQLSFSDQKIRTALVSLERDQLIERNRDTWQVA